MIKLFEKHEDEKYIIVKILFIKITFKKKIPSINLGYINEELNETQKEINISRQLYSKLLIENKFNNYKNIENNPYFSIIVPVYNTNESYLIAAIESVINQTFKDYELIIVDDASTVDYKIKNYNNIKYIKNKTNKGTLYSKYKWN